MAVKDEDRQRRPRKGMKFRGIVPTGPEWSCIGGFKAHDIEWDIYAYDEHQSSPFFRYKVIAIGKAPVKGNYNLEISRLNYLKDNKDARLMMKYRPFMLDEIDKVLGIDMDISNISEPD